MEEELFYGGGVPTKHSTAQEYENLWQRILIYFDMWRRAVQTLIVYASIIQ